MFSLVSSNPCLLIILQVLPEVFHVKVTCNHTSVKADAKEIDLISKIKFLHPFLFLSQKSWNIKNVFVL